MGTLLLPRTTYQNLLRSRTRYLTQQSHDWDFFARIFYVKEYILFEYQTRTLLEEAARLTKWCEEEDCLLYGIITCDRKLKWTEIAKTLFVSSGKRYLRASKQCRERWLNHLDPSKTKSDWTLREYLVLFKYVEEKGKRWALLVKVLEDRRSEHSIKNKYNSMVRKQLRLAPELVEKEACQELIRKVNRVLRTRVVESNDEYLFGCSLKSIELVLSLKGDNSEKKGGRSSSEEMEGYRSKF
jgi:hypothetical protein